MTTPNERDEFVAEVERLVGLGSKVMQERDAALQREYGLLADRDLLRIRVAALEADLARVTSWRDEALAALDRERAELAEAEAAVTNFSFGYDKILADLTKAMRERNEARALLAEAYASQQGAYAEPGCGKHTGNASNRCLRALNHPGPCDENPPLTSVVQNPDGGPR